ncbi:MAG: hypothetical protein WBS24_16480 [Terriglobales bacterium]
MAEPLKADFGIEITFAVGTPDPARIFRSMTSIIDSFQHFDKDLVQVIDVEIDPILLLEDIEAGSLRTWFRNLLTSVDDSALKDGDWKKLVGSYLLKSKYILVKKLEDKTEITNRDEIKDIERDLLIAAQDTDIKRIPVYQPISELRIIQAISGLNASLRNLSSSDSAKLITPDGEAKFNLSLRASPESLLALLVKESLTNESVLILKVKRPDYLGESMWDFKLGEHPLSAKIIDLNFLREFQGRRKDVRPGDAIRARVQTTIDYGYSAEVISEHYEIVEVIDVITLMPQDQPRLLGE